MSKLSFASLILGSSLLALAQSTSPATNPTQSQKEAFEPDTVLMVELNSSLDARQAKPGQSITGTLRGDIWGKTTILLPTGSELIGHVVEAHGHTKESPESKLSVCFDKAHLKDGTEMSLNLVIRDLQIPLEVYPIGTGGDGLGSLNASMGRAGAAPVSPSGPMGNRPSVSAMNIPPFYTQPATIRGGPSGIPDVDLVSTKQQSGSFSVLTSTRHEIKLKKHYLVFLVPVLPEDQPTK